jgi:hypothetical protein
MDGGFVGSDENPQFDKIARSNFERPKDGPKGVGHDCMDAGGRAMPGAIAEG